jgi:uroporphyrinogen-III synthase
LATLGGRVVACLESRNAAELADLVTRHGGIPYPAPCLREVHEPDAAETRRAVQLICGETIHIAIFLTGVGVQTIVEGARHLGREAQLVAGLSIKRVAARGPKTLNALRRFGVGVDLIAPEPFTSGCLLDAIASEWDLRGQTVLVQRYGVPVPAFTDGLTRLGASVLEVSPYRWERPLDEDAVARLIEDLVAGWIDVLAATNAAQVDHLFAIARDRGYEPDLRRALAMPCLRIAAQGTVCASGFEREGVDVDVIPQRTSMGAMIVEIARHADARPPPALSARARVEEVVAICFAGVVTFDDISSVIGDLSADTTVAVLSGRRRIAERMAEQAAVQRNLAVHTVLAAQRGRHPADTLVRRAARVVIVTGDGVHTGCGALLQLAERYAKPAQVLPPRPPGAGRGSVPHPLEHPGDSLVPPCDSVAIPGHVS